MKKIILILALFETSNTFSCQAAHPAKLPPCPHIRLFLATSNNDIPAVIHAVKALGANVNTHLPGCFEKEFENKNGKYELHWLQNPTPLMIAALKGNFTLVVQLVLLGAWIQLTGEDSPLAIAHKIATLYESIEHRKIADYLKSLPQKKVQETAL